MNKALTTTEPQELLIFSPDSYVNLNRRRLRSWVGGVSSDLQAAIKKVAIKQGLEPREAAAAANGKGYLWQEPESLTPRQLEAIALYLLRAADILDEDED